MFDAKNIEQKWKNPTVEMIAHGHANKARKLIINGVEFVEVLPTIFRTKATGTKREMNDLTYLYKEEDFQ